MSIFRKRENWAFATSRSGRMPLAPVGTKPRSNRHIRLYGSYITRNCLQARGLSLPTVLPEAYRIGAGDVLQIAVWREPEASVPAAVVRVDGKISVPLIDEVDAAGYTPLELEKVLGDRFSKYIKNPVVTVIAATINSKRVYVVGGVKKEGPIPLVRPMTVLQALNEAGGLVDFARKRKIYVLRNENGKQVKLPFDYQTVLKGEHLEQNIELLPDDTIVVPQ